MRNEDVSTTRGERASQRSLRRPQQQSSPGRFSSVQRRLYRLFICLASVALSAKVIALLSACSAINSQVADTKPMPFSAYQQATYAQLLAGRKFQTDEPQSELAWNSPQEWRPHEFDAGTKPTKGILLVHGLGDSPWSFNDVAKQLAMQGFLVRTVLLPGHGTHPEDLLEVTVEQWRQVVRSQAAALQRDVQQVFLGGFSTGANLVLEYAYANPDIAGLVLFSPGFRSSSSLDWLTPLVAWFRPWLLSPDGRMPMQNSVRYVMTPTNGFAQFYRSSRAAQGLLRSRPYEKPVFMVVSQHDSVLDTNYLLDVFQRRFVHPASRMVWYGDTPVGLTDTSRVLVRADRLPEMRISQFSHMGVLFSPANPLYGIEGSLRFCWNGQDQQSTQACRQGASVWYSDWGYREDGKVHARLTFNPYFDWQASVMADVLGNRGSRQVTQPRVLAISHPSSLESQP